MSKLRADITWKHRINSDINISPSLKILENIGEENIEEEIEKNAENEKNLDNEKEDEEEEEDLTNLEDELGNYLQGWAEMLEEETLKFQNDEFEINNLDVNSITHPAINPNAKWQLESLFKELEFPF
jgi:hypothetical protein